MKKHLMCQSSHLLMIITVFVYIKKVSHLPSQLGIFVFTFTVKRFHIYGALLHLALKDFTFTWPFYIFTFRGATGSKTCFNCIIGNTKLIQHRFIKPLVFQLGRISHSEKKVVSIEYLKQELSLDNN